MKKIPEILLRSFLRRYPIPTRIYLVNYLGQYVWLKDVLEELRPELFPQREAPEAELAEAVSPKPDASVLGILDRSEIQGRLGRYQAETYLGQRGNGHLFSATDLTSKRPLTIKEFLLPPTRFSKAEALQRQNRFQQLGGLQLADGRFFDFRVLQPIEAIADTESHERCFLVTEGWDRSPTLRQSLHLQGALAEKDVGEILSQILQSLDFLHQQKFSLPSGAIQNGLVHGNLSLDSVLWVSQKSQTFVYLCDLRLWEQCFDPAETQERSTEVTPHTLQQDLKAVGDMGLALLQGTSDTLPPIDPAFRQILDFLKTQRFDSAEAARRELLKLAPRSPDTIAPLADLAAQMRPKSRFPLVLIGTLLGLLVAAIVLLPRLRSSQAKPAIVPPAVSTCCLKEVSGIPEGEYLYTAVQGGTWWTVLQQRDLLQQNQSLTDALDANQPNLLLGYVPAESLEEVLELVQSGEVDFAVMPLIEELPQDLLGQEIAYDGLATVVSFSYSQRQQGLPSALEGRLTLDQVRRLYTQQVIDWEELGGPPLRVRSYASRNPEAIVLFEQRVLSSQNSQAALEVEDLPTLELLRQVIRDFEKSDIGSIGFAPLSEIWGQCSVYPLALGQKGKAPVQTLILSNGEAISPATDLCSRKGSYRPDPRRFQTGDYPLSYPIMVVYPRDNRRSTIGRKFVELMRTVEGQRLLQAAGLVPLSPDLKASPPPSPAPR